MFPWIELGSLVLRLLPQFVVSPIFWLVVLLVHGQYRRINRLERDMFGIEFSSVGKQVWRSVLFGLLGGVAGSFLLTLVGVSLTGAGIIYVWPVAILLMLISPRFMCFAYAGGIVSLSYLLFGFPKVEIPQLLALVAVLHMIESILIWFTGHLDPTPVVIKRPGGDLVGGFNLQKFWPIPVIVMLAVVVESPEQLIDLIKMPDWWPLVKPGEVPGPGQELVYSMFLVTAALGYNDLAVTCRPREKARRSALNLALYSLILLVLAVASSFFTPLLVGAALLSPLGHEMVVHLGSRRELVGQALFRHPAQGVRVLAVVPGSPAEELDIQPGEVVLSVNGQVLNSPGEVEEVLAGAPAWELVTLQPEGEGYRQRYLILSQGTSNLGVVFLPKGKNVPYVQIKNQGPLRRLWRRLILKVKKGD